MEGLDPRGGAADDYPRHWEADVLLRNGHPVRLRPIRPGDATALQRFHASLSGQTVYFRFFSVKPVLSEKEAIRFTTVDHHDRVALLALDAGSIIGVGRYDVIGDGVAEVAFVIRDDRQGMGLGSVLLEHLAAAARERGVTRFVAEVLPENGRMLAIFREAGFEVAQHREEDVLALGFDVEPTQTSRTVMESREHRAEARSVYRLLHPRTVVVIGASRSGRGPGYAVLEHLVAGGYRGRLVAVHPEATALLGVPCVRSLAAAGPDVDLAVVVVPAEAVAPAIADAPAAGVHGLVVVSGGFGDAGGATGPLQGGLVSLVHATGMRLVGPNALGVINTDPQVRLNASLVPRMPTPGVVGLFSQSGALGTSILDRFAARGLGLSTFVSAGNRADISGNDLLQYWEDDPRTAVVALHLETIGNARKFARIVHRVSLSKPVVMVRSGGGERRHPLGHAVRNTDLSQRAVDQILGDVGLVVVDGIDRLIDVARLAATQPLPSCSGLAIVGNSDALAVLAENAVRGTGLSITRPPVALARLETPEAYGRALAEAVADPNVGIVLVVYVPPVEQESDAAIRETLRRACDGSTTILAVMLTSAPDDLDGASGECRVPIFDDVDDAIRAVDCLARYADWRAQAPSPMTTVPGAGDPSLATGTRHGHEALDLLAAIGVRVTYREQVDAAAGLGCRLQLRADPLFGSVLVIGIDDPVAEALDDRACRLAPVSASAALAMLDGLGAADVLGSFGREGREGRGRLADLAALVSELPSIDPRIAAVDIRGARACGDDAVTVTALSVTVSARPGAVDPVARRL